MDVNDLNLVSYTDIKCMWKMPHAKSIEKYTLSPCKHKCLNQKFKKEYTATLTKKNKEKK